MAGTPCETVVGQAFEFYPRGVVDLFADGSLGEFHIQGYAGYPLFDSEGRPLGLFAVMTRGAMHSPARAESILRIFSSRAASEIERQRAEHALRRSEEHYRGIFNASVDALAVLTTGGVVVDINPAAEKMYGYCRSEVLGRPLTDFFRDPGQHAIVRDFVGKVLASGYAQTEDRAWHKDGSRFHVEPRGVPITFEGRPHILVIIRDVTERRERENALRRSEDHLRATVEAALDCIVTMDSSGRIIDFNPAAERCFGYRGEQVIGRRLSETIVPPRYRRAHARWLRRYLASGAGQYIGRRIETAGLRADGSEFPVEMAIGTARGPDGLIFIGYLRDITERQRAEQSRRNLEAQLRQAQKMEAIGQLTGGIAHDFNNILTSVLGYMGMAEDRARAAADERQEGYLRKARHSPSARGT